MNNLVKSIALLCIFNNFSAEVTYNLSGGRFGDNLLAYLHAKWVSFSYDIPLRYKPFDYSDQLILDNLEKSILDVSLPRLNTCVLTKKDMTIDKNKRRLYVVPYFAEVLSEHRLPGAKDWIYFKVDWENPQFKEMIKKLIAPKDQSVNVFTVPQDMVTVALHVRKGGGFDSPLLSDATKVVYPLSRYADYHSMLKFPPVQFYIDQLAYIQHYFGNQPLYVYVFTDDRNPEALVERIKNKLPDSHTVTFDYRKSGNSHDANVLEDFFALTKFDCLVRPQSNFSLVAAKISDYLLEIFPAECHWEGTKPIIDHVEIVRRKDS